MFYPNVCFLLLRRKINLTSAMKSNEFSLPVIVVALASLPLLGYAATENGQPFLNRVTCPLGYVPGTKETGCVKDVDPSKLRVQPAKKLSAQQGVGTGVATAAQVSVVVPAAK
jgi:hypothetical protein